MASTVASAAPGSRPCQDQDKRGFHRQVSARGPWVPPPGVGGCLLLELDSPPQLSALGDGHTENCVEEDSEGRPGERVP